MFSTVNLQAIGAPLTKELVEMQSAQSKHRSRKETFVAQEASLQKQARDETIAATIADRNQKKLSIADEDMSLKAFTLEQNFRAELTA